MSSRKYTLLIDWLTTIIVVATLKKLLSQDQSPVKIKLENASIDVIVNDRRGLLAEISDLLYQSGLSVSRHSGQTNDSSGRGSLKFEVTGVAGVCQSRCIGAGFSLVLAKRNHVHI